MQEKGKSVLAFDFGGGSGRAFWDHWKMGKLL